MTKILIDRAVVEQALDALQDADTMMEHRQDLELRHSAMAALRAALKQPQVEQEPVAAQCRFEGEAEWRHCTVAHHLHVQAHPKEWPHYETRALYTHSQNLNCKSIQHRLATLWGYEKPQPPRQPLTPKEIVALCNAAAAGEDDLSFAFGFRLGVVATERHHGIREPKK